MPRESISSPADSIAAINFQSFLAAVLLCERIKIDQTGQTSRLRYCLFNVAIPDDIFDKLK